MVSRAPIVLIVMAMTGCSNADDASSASNDAGASVADAAAARDGSVANDAATDAGARAPQLVYASGYGDDISIFSVDFASGTLTAKASLPAGDPSPSFLALRPNHQNLYAVGESAAGRVGAYAIDATSGALSYLGGVSSEGNGPAFVSVDPTGAWVMVANYGDGGTAVLPIQPGGSLGPPTDTRNAGLNAHMMITDASGKFVFVPCLGSDYVAQYRFDPSTGHLTANAPATFKIAASAKSGPRHLAFHPSGTYAYLVNETASSISSLAFSVSTGLLSEIETQSTLPAGYAGPKNTAAEIWVHPTGKFVYASNRGDDSIAIFSVDPSTGKLTAKGHPKSGGAMPRSITIDPTGAFLYSANQGASTLTSFAIDPSDGSLSPIGSPIAQDQASFVGVLQR